LIRIEVIQRPSISSIDGVQTGSFEPGKRYEVGNSIGAVFLAEGWAIPVPLDSTAVGAPVGDEHTSPERSTATVRQI
jgi:hypothetical protein